MIIKLAIPLKIFEICNFGLAKCYLNKDIIIDTIVTDSREARNGNLFIALRGERQNGCDFLDDAKGRGAYTLAEYGTKADLLCENSENFLLRLSGAYLSLLPVLKFRIAITGSVGKTTAKEFTASILSEKYSVHKTYENYNNSLGLSFTILSSPKNTEAIVAELGMNDTGEISALSKVFMPTHAVITNIMNAHIGKLGSRKMIAEAKLEILDGLVGNTLFAPYEEPLLKERGFVYFSTYSADADRYLSKQQNTVSYYEGNLFKLSAKTPLNTEHHLNALLIAISVASELDICDESIIRGIEKTKADILRQKIYEIGEIRILDDTYSSSPEAVIAEIKALAKQNVPFSLVLGDMLELGDVSESEHMRVGKTAYEMGAKNIYTFGRAATHIAEGAISAGMDRVNIFINESISSPEISAEQIRANSTNGEIILIKASHAIHAERIIERLKDLK